jgi:hypothetical protein
LLALEFKAAASFALPLPPSLPLVAVLVILGEQLFIGVHLFVLNNCVPAAHLVSSAFPQCPTTFVCCGDITQSTNVSLRAISRSPPEKFNNGSELQGFQYRF